MISLYWVFYFGSQAINKVFYDHAVSVVAGYTTHLHNMFGAGDLVIFSSPCQIPIRQWQELIGYLREQKPLKGRTGAGRVTPKK